MWALDLTFEWLHLRVTQAVLRIVSWVSHFQGSILLHLRPERKERVPEAILLWDSTFPKFETLSPHLVPAAFCGSEPLGTTVPLCRDDTHPERCSLHPQVCGLVADWEGRNLCDPRIEEFATQGHRVFCLEHCSMHGSSLTIEDWASLIRSTVPFAQWQYLFLLPLHPERDSESEGGKGR